jgi:hypothetical protein
VVDADALIEQEVVRQPAPDVDVASATGQLPDAVGLQLLEALMPFFQSTPTTKRLHTP